MAKTQAQPQSTAKPAATAKQASLYVGTFSSSGPRPYNEDNIDVRRTSKRLIALVADGMGGGEVGASVSDQAIKFAAESLQEARSDSDIGEQIRQAFSLAHQSARNFRLMGDRYTKSGSTLVCAVLESTSRGMTAHIGNIGDSRVYRVRGKQVTQLSTDHNVYEQLVAQGVEPEEARKHASARKLTYCLGTSNDIASAPNLYTRHEMQVGDVLLLCSDGVGEFVNEGQIAAIVGRNPAEKAAQKIVEQALANKSNDNASAVVVSYGRRRSLPLPLLAILALLLALGVGISAVLASNGGSSTAVPLVNGASVTPVPTELQAQATSTALALVTSTYAPPPTWSPTPSITPSPILVVVTNVPQATRRPGQPAQPTSRPNVPQPQPTNPPSNPNPQPQPQPTNPPSNPNPQPQPQPTNPPSNPNPQPNPTSPPNNPPGNPPTAVPVPPTAVPVPPTAVPVPPTAVPVPPTAVPVVQTPPPPTVCNPVPGTRDCT